MGYIDMQNAVPVNRGTTVHVHAHPPSPTLGPLDNEGVPDQFYLSFIQKNIKKQHIYGFFAVI